MSGLTAEQAYGLSRSEIKKVASGFDHAERTGDNTFSIFFVDGSKIDLTIPLPKDGEPGKKGDDGISIVGAYFNSSKQLVIELSDGTELPPLTMPTASVEVSKEEGNIIEQKADGMYAPKTDAYTKTETDNKFLSKDDAGSTYATKTDLNTKASTEQLLAIANTIGEKVNTSDIVDDLTSIDGTVPLSAKQGKVLKNEIDNINSNITPLIGLSDEAFQMRVGDVGGKNLIRQTAQNHSVNGITVSTNLDMSIYAKGTVTSSVYNRSIGNTITLTPGTYTLSGCPSGGSTSTYRLCIMTASDYTIIASDVGNSITFSVNDTNDYYVCIRVEVGKTVDGTFYPMLVKGTEALPYERYVPSMAEIADKQINNDMWNSTTSYAVGDYVLHNNTLYRCIIACTNIAPPNTTYWVASNITSEFKSVNNSFNNLLKPSSFNSVQIYDDFGVLENGGYIQNGNLVHIHLKIKLSKSLTADTLYYFGQNVPSPVDCALITVYGAYKRIYGSGGFTTATSLNFTTNVDIPSGSTIYIDSTYYAQ